MVARNVPTTVALPRSHYFLTISRAGTMRTFAFRIPVLYGLLALIGLLGVGGTGSILYLLFHDDLVASLMARQSQQQYAYEDRIEALKSQIEQQTRHQASDDVAIENKVRDLVLRQAKLESRAAIMAGLTGPKVAARTDAAGGSWAVRAIPGSRAPQALQAVVGRQSTPTELPAGLLSYASPPAAAVVLPMASKPHPEPDLVQPETSPVESPGPLSALDGGHSPVPARLSLISASLDDVEHVQLGTLLRIGSRARDEATRLRQVLAEAGLSPERFTAAGATQSGGPFVPLDDRDTPFGKALSGLRDTLVAAGRLRAAVDRAPFSGPLPGSPEITSVFGPRVDPFLGRAAMHTGVDLKQAYGADVRATASGRVAFAGAAGGYGNMVEVDHGDGLSTRYAHLSQIEVAEGQTVAKGAVVGLIGTTGRSTGPHLHYEVRIDGEAVDPVRFLNAGAQLALAEAH